MEQEANQETEVHKTDEGEKVGIAFSEETKEFRLPVGGDLEALLALQETKEIMVHGKPLIINASQINNYLQSEDSAINTEEELGQLLEAQLSKEDVVKIYNQQLHRKLVGQQFEVSEVGELGAKSPEDLVLIVPQVKLEVSVVEQAIEAIESDDLNKYVTYLPPTNDEETLNPVRCVTGSTLRTFLNEMQEESGGLDMNSQILVYCKLLTLMPDEDATKKYGLSQLRALMQYGDIVSNKPLRLALTELIEEEMTNE